MYQFSERIHSLDYFVQAINHSNETVTKLILATLVFFMTKQRPDMDDIAHSHRRHFLYTYVYRTRPYVCGCRDELFLGPAHINNDP